VERGGKCGRVYSQSFHQCIVCFSHVILSLLVVVGVVDVCFDQERDPKESIHDVYTASKFGWVVFLVRFVIVVVVVVAGKRLIVPTNQRVEV
jgi:hypothetical protein